ncbi:MAG: ferrochelatase [Nitrospirae bacterium]|nr:ferrochelatase [Nitrospirota bacterium]
MNHPASIAILLINLGGPDSLESVEPFLFNLFSDPDIMGYNRILLKPLAKFISRRRSPLVRGYYNSIGGKSPILELTRQQAEALQKALPDSDRFKVFVAMRYWHPFIEDVVKDIIDFQPQKIIVLPLYPHYSITTTGSSINEFNRAWSHHGDTHVEVKIVREWYDNPFYINALCETVLKTFEYNRLDLKTTHIVFSAHGIPLRFIKDGDPYSEQIEKCVELTARQLGVIKNCHLSYQSRVGPLKWLGPYTEDVLKELGDRKVSSVVLVPISFVSDHMETLYEIDILYRKRAKGYGISNYYRVPALNDSPLFIESLKDIVLQV